MDDRIYTERKILTGVLIGGALAGGYYLWRTFNALGKPKHAMVAVIVAVIVLAVTIGSIFIPVLDRIPNIVFYGIQIGLAMGAIRGYLYAAMYAHVESGKAVYGWGNTISIAAISMLVTLVPLISLIYISPGTFDRSTARYYGILKHEIVFDHGNISELDVAHIAGALTSTGFFDDAVQKTVDATRSGDRFIITIYCSDEARSPEAVEAYKTLRSEIQRSFPVNPITVDMVVGTPDNRIARLE